MFWAIKIASLVGFMWLLMDLYYAGLAGQGFLIGTVLFAFYSHFRESIFHSIIAGVLFWAYSAAYLVSSGYPYIETTAVLLLISLLADIFKSFGNKPSE
jgi:hypothetical protein